MVSAQKHDHRKRPTKPTRKKRKKKRGRPPFRFDLAKVEELAAAGLSSEQIAHLSGCTRATVWRHLANEPKFRDAYKKGQARRDQTLLSNLFSLSRESAAAGIFLAKQWLGFRTNPIPEINTEDKVELELPISDGRILVVRAGSTVPPGDNGKSKNSEPV